MTFLEPSPLIALPLAALPVIIHLVHLYRRKQVKWAAMMFLLAAQQMNKGLSRLKQILILSLRVLAVAAILLAITRPLAGGWLGLTGGAPDTVLILLDRSASMEQSNPTSGLSKRLAGLRNLSQALDQTVGTRSKLVLIESAQSKPLPIDRPALLLDLPQTEPTDTTADIPALLQHALDFISTNKTGRTDIWLLSDLQTGDWDRSGGRWETLRSSFLTLQGVRFHLLTYPELPVEDLGVRIDRVTRRQTDEKAELLIDLHIDRHGQHSEPQELTLRFVVNGVATSTKITVKDSEATLQAYALPIDKSLRHGWGRVELPADTNPANDCFYFVFDEPPSLGSIVVAEDASEAAPLAAALAAPAEPSLKYASTVLSVKQAPEIPWEKTGLLLWQAPIPPKDDPLHQQIRSFVMAGHSVIFLPPNSPDGTEIFGLHWDCWHNAEKPLQPDWWRNDADLLANTRDGSSLPVGAIELTRICSILGTGVPLSQVPGHGALLMRSTSNPGAYFLGTLPGSGFSSLARDGVVMFALLHRALNEGAKSLGNAQQRWASATALGEETRKWQSAENKDRTLTSERLPLHAAVLSTGDQLLALNRPPAEDHFETLSPTTLHELFAGLDFRILTDSLENGRSLTSEVWRTFLFAMALALLGETLLCLPPRKNRLPSESKLRTANAA